MAICKGWRSRRRCCLFLAPLVIFIPFLLSVSELRGATDDANDPVRNPSKKPDHLVFGPAAGQGLPDRLQCDGLKAMNKIESPSSHQKLNSSNCVSFVTVFTIYNTTQRLASALMDDVVTVGNKSYSKTERSMAILSTYVNFIQVSMPQSNVVILTDPASDFSINQSNVTVLPILGWATLLHYSDFSINQSNVTVLPIQGDHSREKLMLQRIRSYIDFLGRKIDEYSENLVCPNHYIFTDSDVAIVNDLTHIFENHPHFHLALTFRNNKDQPLNSGFIAVRGTPDGMLKSRVFLEQVLDVYNSQYMKASRMLGDQLSLAHVVKFHLSYAAKKFKKPEAFSGDINGASILFLPCVFYNWTPPEGAGQFHGMPLGVQVVHFKGSRKRLMLESWDFFNSTSNMSDMLCLVLNSGRTKYDF